MPQNEEIFQGSMLRSMVLLSTLSTAAEVWHAAQDRRAGRDPSGQEAVEPAVAELRVGREELEGALMRLRAGLVYTRHHEEDPAAYLVRHFDALMTLGRLARLLHLIHQRLLSLYPAVSETILEEVRELEGACAQVAEAEEADFRGQLEPFVEQGCELAARLREEVG